MITNVGFDERATHTKEKSDVAEMPHQKVKFPLTHPEYVHRDMVFEQYIEQKFYSEKPSVPQRIKNKIKSWI